MNTRHKLMIGFALVHLSLVAMGAAGVTVTPIQSDHVPLVEWYRHLSGSNNNYQFFAPGVGAEERVAFVLIDANGREWTDTLRIGNSREANLSFETIPFVLAAVDDETAWNMLHSMADGMLRRHPAAVTVLVRVETYATAFSTGDDKPPNFDFPTMREYRAGKRPHWHLLYELTFTRNGDVALAM